MMTGSFKDRNMTKIIPATTSIVRTSPIFDTRFRLFLYDLNLFNAGSSSNSCDHAITNQSQNAETSTECWRHEGIRISDIILH